MTYRQVGWCAVWLVCGGVALSCGSDDGKKASQDSQSGAGGEPSSGGSSSGPDEGGTAGTGATGTSGDGGVPGGGTPATDAGTGGTETMAGAGGMPDEPEPNPLDRWLDPMAGADTNDGTSAPVAYRTLAHALTEMVSGGTLWLLDGTIGGSSTEPSTGGYTALEIPDGVSVRAVNDGAVTIGEGVSGMNPPSFLFLGSGSLRGVNFDGVAIPIKASTGTIELEALTFKNAGGGCDSFTRSALDLSGDAQVTLTAGSVTEYAGPGSNVKTFAFVGNDASLKIVGGSFTDLAAGICSPRHHFVMVNNGKLELDGVDIVDAAATADGNYPPRGGVISLMGPNTELVMTDSDIDGGTGNAPGIFADGGGTPHITLVNSSLTHHVQAGIMLGSEGGAFTPVVSLTGVTITNNRNGILASGSYGPAAVDITSVDSIIADNEIAGVYLGFGGSIDISGGEISGNATNEDTYWGTYGGLHFGGVDGLYDVKLRNVLVNNTESNNNLPTAAIQVRGNAASTFDFGTLAEPGGNNFTGNVRTAVELIGGNAATVSAIGNTWNANVQAATAAGLYTAPTTVTSGAGTNYIVSAGTLILAETP